MKKQPTICKEHKIRLGDKALISVIKSELNISDAHWKKLTPTQRAKHQRDWVAPMPYPYDIVD